MRSLIVLDLSYLILLCNILVKMYLRLYSSSAEYATDLHECLEDMIKFVTIKHRR